MPAGLCQSAGRFLARIAIGIAIEIEGFKKADPDSDTDTDTDFGQDVFS